MFQTFSLLFFFKKNKISQDGKAPIYMRITVNGKRSQISIKRKVAVEKWNSEAGKVVGKSMEVRELNRYLNSLENKIFKIQQKLLEDNRPISALLFKNIFTGKIENHKMIHILM